MNPSATIYAWAVFTADRYNTSVECILSLYNRMDGDRLRVIKHLKKGLR